MNAMTFRDYANLAARLGLSQIGSGAYSSVFAPVTSDKVLKINRRHDGWLEYVMWATKNGYAGGLAPKVFSFKICKDHYVAVVERMAETLNSAQGEVHNHWRNIEFALSRTRWKDPYTPNSDTLKAYPEYPDFVAELTAFQKTLPQSRFDIHPGNWMTRPNGRLCFTDPFVVEDWQPSMPKRMRMVEIAMTRNAAFQSQQAMENHR